MEENFTPTTSNEPTPQFNPQGANNASTQQPYSPPVYASTNTYAPTENGAQNNNVYNQSQQPMQPPINPAYAPSQPQKSKQSKKKGAVGKAVFVALICLCIVISSIALGTSLSGRSKFNIPSADTPTGEFNPNTGAQPDIEDSPLSFSEYSGDGTMTPEQIYNEVKDINVGLLVYARNQKIGEGSGIIVGEDKTGTYTYILTAAHVISDEGISVQIQFSDETEAPATIVGVDTKTDIGVVKVSKTGFKAATFGNSDKLNVGQKVYAIGNPGGTEFFGSFTSGLVSAIDRPVPSTNSSYDLPCIQHNAAINPGNSGGALVNEYGQVIGLNSSKISSMDYEGMGFAVPSNTVIEIYNSIITYGYVSGRPKLGISYMPISSDYDYMDFALKNGLPYGSVVIAEIGATSDLASKDVKVGDIITAVNGKKLETTDILLKEIEESKIGDEITLTIYRSSGSDIKSFDVTVTLIEDRGDASSAKESSNSGNPFGDFWGNGN